MLFTGARATLSLWPLRLTFAGPAAMLVGLAAGVGLIYWFVAAAERPRRLPRPDPRRLPPPRTNPRGTYG